MCFKLKQGKEIITQVICVRGIEHARQGSTKRSEVPKRSAVRNAPTLAQQGTRPKEKIKTLSALQQIGLKFKTTKILTSYVQPKVLCVVVKYRYNQVITVR
ncbi:MAG: hypothetical protein NZ455_16720 [Bacteroidia bacterium]|nr:hypothetical protein [Bacteroidia bacterium]